MKTQVFSLVALASAQLASATYDWRNAKSFSCPDNTDNVCIPSQSGGWKWEGLNIGKFIKYNDFDFNGFECADSFDGKKKRDLITGRTFQNKCIKGKATEDYDSAPSFGCGSSKDVEKFSVKTFQVSVEYDTDLEFHYEMPDGSKCKQKESCKKDGTTVKNTQCGGAKKVRVVIPKGKDKGKGCGVGFHDIEFDCNPPKYTTTTTKVKTTTTTTTTTPKVMTTTTTTTSKVYNPPATTTTATTTTTSPEAEVPSTTTPEVPGVTTTTTTTTSPEVEVPSTTTTPEVPGVTTTTTTTTSEVQTTTTSASETTTPVCGQEGYSSCPPASTPTPPTETPVCGGEGQEACPPTETPVCGGEGQEACPPTETETPTCGVEGSPACPSETETPACGGEGQAVCPPASTTTAATTTQQETTTTAQTTTTSYSPAPTADCPELLPQCMNTWIFLTGCKSNTDSACFCASYGFVDKIYKCLAAYGASDDEVDAAEKYFQGICAPQIPQNPVIITGTNTLTITAPPVYQTVPVTTVVLETTVVVPCTETAGPSQGEVIPGSSTTQYISTTIVVPQVVFETITGVSTNVAALVQGTPALPAAAPASTTLAVVPTTLTNVLVNNTASSTALSPAFTGAASKSGMTSGTFLAAGLIVMLAL